MTILCLARSGHYLDAEEMRSGDCGDTKREILQCQDAGDTPGSWWWLQYQHSHLSWPQSLLIFPHLTQPTIICRPSSSTTRVNLRKKYLYKIYFIFAIFLIALQSKSRKWMVPNEFHFSGPNLICSQSYPPYSDQINVIDFWVERAWDNQSCPNLQYFTISQKYCIFSHEYISKSTKTCVTK